MKIKRSLLKRYITIQLDEAELAKREQVKAGNKLSDRKIYMAMIDALIPTTPDENQTVKETKPQELKGIGDEMPNDGISPEIISEEE